MYSVILDGYTITATITIKPWPTITFNYRPALPDKVNDWIVAGKLTGKERTNAAMKLLTDNLVSWDVKARAEDADTVPCLEANWRKLPFPILDKLIDHVAGFAIPEGTDPN